MNFRERERALVMRLIGAKSAPEPLSRSKAPERLCATTLRPAMAAGITNHAWMVEELLTASL